MRVLVGIMLCASLLAGERENEPENWEYDQVTGERKMPRLEGEFPFLASVLNYRDNARCLGALIEPGVVLTAAHCVEPSRDVTVIVGRHLRDSSQVEVHPSYRRDDKFNHRSDVAKIYFDGPIPGVDPVSFHTDVLAGDIGVSVDRRYKVPVEVLSSGRVIRAGDPMGHVVKGDSGGPLLFWTLKGWSQAGVVSKTHSDGWGFYTSVTVLGWDDPDPTPPPPPVDPPMPPKPPPDPVDYDRRFKENAEAHSSIHVDCYIVPGGILSRCDLKWSPRIADYRKYRDAPYLIGCHSRDEFGEPIAGSGARWEGRLPDYYSVVRSPLNWDNEKIPNFESARSVRCSVTVDGKRWVIQ